MKRIILLLTAVLLLAGCSTQKDTAEEPTATAVVSSEVMEVQTLPATEETTQPTEPELPWDPDVRWYSTYYFDKRPNPDPNIVEGVVRFNSLIKNETSDPLTIESAHADFYMGTKIVAQEDFDGDRLLDFLPHPRVGDLVLNYGEPTVFQLYSTIQQPGSYDRVIVTYTISDVNGNQIAETFHFAVNEEDVTPYSTSDRTDWSLASWSEERWSFYALLYNDTNSYLEFVGVYDTTFLNGLPMGSDLIDKSRIAPNAFKELQKLSPGQMVQYQSGITHQYNYSDERESTYVYKKPSGELYLQTFRFALDDEHSVVGADTIAHSIYATFDVQMLNTAEQIQQVLGAPQYDRAQIRQMIEEELTVEELAERISTIYDAQQFFLEADIDFVDGDIKQSTNGIQWHYNDSPALVLQQGYGNCGSGSSTFNYLLQNDYDEQGYCVYAGNRGGHIFNYFRNGEQYYVLDWVRKEEDCFVLYVADSLESACDAFIHENHIVSGSSTNPHILLLYTYPYNGSARPIGDTPVRTNAGYPFSGRLPSEIENLIQIQYLEDEKYAPIFTEAPPISQWPKDAQ